MPRTGSGPHLWFDKTRETWTIVDGKKKRRTGFVRNEIREAKKELADYIASQHIVEETSNPILGDVISLYIDEVTAGQPGEGTTLRRLKMINAWWGDKVLSDVTAANCRAYIAHRDGADTVARSELSFLRAAIKHYHKHHKKIIVPTLFLPERRQSRVRWLTRSEAAAFLWACRRSHPYVARFFIIGWYSGSRKTVILQMRWSQVDLETRILHRKPPGAKQTKKRAPPIRIGFRLLAHLRRWHRMDGGGNRVIIRQHQSQSEPLANIDRSWNTIRNKLGLDQEVTPHVLRHSRATHLMRQGVDMWEASQFLGMTVKMLETVYGHHRPEWQSGASDAK